MESYRRFFTADYIEPLFILLLPCVIYLHMVFHYAVNIPFWDDYSVVLYPVNEMVGALKANPSAFSHFLFMPNAGHIPAVTHMVAWIQVVCLGGINFKWSIVAGNVGLLLTVLVFVMYFGRQLQCSFGSAIPIPFLLLSIVHWEAMDFMVPAWQFYWGSCLFPVLVFVAIVERHWIRAALFFAPALFLSSGALAVYLLALVYCALKKDGRGIVIFGVLAGLLLLVYFHYLPPQSVETKFPDVITLLFYVTTFMGSVIPDLYGHLYPYATLHFIMGICALSAGFYLVWKCKTGDALKLIFIYVALLAVMAVCKRGHEGWLAIPPRYSIFALLSLVSLYGLFLAHAKSLSPALRNRSVIVVSLVTMLLWTYSAYACRNALEINKISRIQAMHLYRNGNPAGLESLLWDKEYGRKVMDRARELGIYDIRNSGVE